MERITRPKRWPGSYRDCLGASEQANMEVWTVYQQEGSYEDCLGASEYANMEVWTVYQQEETCEYDGCYEDCLDCLGKYANKEV